MEKRDKFVILITFLFGFFCGFYLYLVGFSPTYSIDKGPTTESDFVVLGEQYGGCDRTKSCPAFRIDEDRNYSYVRGGVGQNEVYEGVLPIVLFDELVEVVESSDLQIFSETIDAVSCASFGDGIDVQYTITIEEDEYFLDTCKSAFSHAVPLGELFLNIWQYFESETK